MPRVLRFCEREHVKRSLSPAIIGAIGFILEFIGVFNPCGLVQNTTDGRKIGLDAIQNLDSLACEDYPRGYNFDSYLWAAKIMSGASLTIGGFALVMTIVSQFLWAGMLFWKCLALWKAMSAVIASLIFVIIYSPLCESKDGEESCTVLTGGYMIICGACLWFLAGLLGAFFPPPDVPSPNNLSGRITTTMAGGESMAVTPDKPGPSPFAGVSY